MLVYVHSRVMIVLGAFAERTLRTVLQLIRIYKRALVKRICTYALATDSTYHNLFFPYGELFE